MGPLWTRSSPLHFVIHVKYWPPASNINSRGWRTIITQKSSEKVCSLKWNWLRIAKLLNQAWTWFHFSPFAWNEKCVIDISVHFLWFWVKNLTISALFSHLNGKLRGLSLNRNSWESTEVKPNSVKWWKLLSSVNFPWIWIHQTIKNGYIYMYVLAFLPSGIV